MSLHPLLDLANDREVKQAKGFRAVAVDQNGEKLELLYKSEVKSAPNREEKGKEIPGREHRSDSECSPGGER